MGELFNTLLLGCLDLGSLLGNWDFGAHGRLFLTIFGRLTKLKNIPVHNFLLGGAPPVSSEASTYAHGVPKP